MTHQKIYDKLNSFYYNERIPHIIFYGPSGSGKKTILTTFLKQIYKDESKMHSNVMFVNCAHSKGIKFIREELKFFAQTNTQLNTGIKFKSIVLLNAEHLTVDAQSAMRRCIEQFSNNTRFFIVITNKSKLLVPILSRFCEIYVPLDTTTNTSYTQTNSFDQERQTHFDTIMCDFTHDHNKMVEIASQIYENAYSTHDLVKWIATQPQWTEYKKANIGMTYMKIKSEYRCEKLLLLYILNLL
jgi:hypothetical protein